MSTAKPPEHELKTWPDYFNALLDGRKRFEYRRDDRGFKVGDTLHLREWEPTFENYTGREMRVRVTYILPVSRDFVVMSVADPGAQRRPTGDSCSE